MRILIFICLIFFSSCNSSPNLESEKIEKTKFISNLLEDAGIEVSKLNLFIQAFKKERVLEVWAKNKTDNKFKKLIDYKFCKFSGELGPKRKEGDKQIPEGCYIIDRFNPNSKFHLSLGINYPNKSDKIRGNKNKPGSDIFIHGGCVTIGCIPITNDKIEELYLLAELAKESGQKNIHVFIFPAKMTASNLQQISKGFPKYVDFWNELKPIYDNFEETKKIPKVIIDQHGKYKLI